jgi:hypothetical protein
LGEETAIFRQIGLPVEDATGRIETRLVENMARLFENPTTLCATAMAGMNLLAGARC